MKFLFSKILCMRNQTTLPIGHQLTMGLMNLNHDRNLTDQVNVNKATKENTTKNNIGKGKLPTITFWLIRLMDGNMSQKTKRETLSLDPKWINNGEKIKIMKKMMDRIANPTKSSGKAREKRLVMLFSSSFWLSFQSS